MKQICERRGVAFVATCYCNCVDDDQPSVEFAAHCAAQGVQFVSLVKEFTGDPSLYTCRRVNGRTDLHYGRLGTKTYAAALAPALQQILRSQP